MTRTQPGQREAFFLSTPHGSRFAIATRPAEAPVGGLLYLHPFAEELNKSRRMVALATEAFARQGWLVLQVDLAGCGDSEGDFGDADWQWWLDDTASAWSWLRSRCDGPVGVWSLRAGGLVLSDWLARESQRPPLLLWQPVGNGLQHLTQFLRLKSASEMLTASGEKGVVSKLRAELAANRTVEVAGYRISPALASGLSAATLRLPPQYSAPVAIFEVTASANPVISLGIATIADTWANAGVPVITAVVRGPSFWQTLEIETTPELIAASSRVLDGFRQ